MISVRKLLTAFAILLLPLAFASTALGSGKTVINDCSDDEVLSKTYTQKEYRDALAQLPADADQYGNCRDIIARAQDAAATKGGSQGGGSDNAASAGGATTGGTSGSGPSSAPAKDQLAAATAEDRAAALEAARGESSDAPLGVATPDIVSAADVARAPDSDGLADLPLPILVLLALLLAGTLALAASRIRSLVHTRRA